LLVITDTNTHESTKHEILVRQAHHPEEFEGEIRKNCKFKKDGVKKRHPIASQTPPSLGSYGGTRSALPL